jgi:hypothetical protein
MNKKSITSVFSSFVALSLAIIPALAFAQSDATFNNLTVIDSVTAPGLITNADLASVAPSTFKCNPATSSASPTDCTANAGNPLDFGAIANSSAAAAANTAAFQSAMAANPVFHCPDGQAFYIGSVTVPTTTTRIYGNCTLIASGTIPSGNGIFEVVNNTAGLLIDGPVITSAIASYPTNVAVRVSSSSNFTVRNVNVTAAGNGIQIISGSNFNLLGNSIGSFGTIGIYITGSSSQGNITNNYVNGQLLSGSSHCIALAQGSSYTVTGNQVYNCYNFGISVASVPSTQGVLSNVTISGNLINGTRVECVNFDNVAVGSVTGNTCIFNSNSQDFGMSFFGTPGTSPQEVVQDINVTGNTIYNPCKSGIALADVVFRLNVVGNYIYTPNQCNGGTADYQSGILLYGGGNTKNNVANNYIVDTAGHMAWQIGEGTYSDGTGNPDGNFLEGAAGTVGTSGQIFSFNSTSSQVVNTFNSWIAYTPVLSCGSGSPGSQSATGRYKQMGKTVVVQVNARLITAGTCSGNIKVSLPFAAATSGELNGREAGTTGATLSGSIASSGNTAQILTYSNAAPIASGDNYVLNGQYERQ